MRRIESRALSRSGVKAAWGMRGPPYGVVTFAGSSV